MTKRRPAYQRYPKEWLSHTAHLSLAAAGFLDRLQCWIWEHSEDQCSIADDPAAIALATRVPLDQVEAAMGEVMNPHLPLLKRKNGRLIVGHFEKQIGEMSERSRKAKQSVAKRWENSSDTNVSKTDTNVSENDTNVSKKARSVIHCNSSMQTAVADADSSKQGVGVPGEGGMTLAQRERASRYSLDEVLIAAHTAGIPPDVARAYFDSREGMDWLHPRTSRPIGSMAGDLNGFWRSWCDRDKVERGKAKGGGLKTERPTEPQRGSL